MNVKPLVSILLVLFIAVVLSAGCVAEQTAKEGDTVSVYYTLSLDDGTVKESNVGKTPLKFTVGSGQMISGFDAAVNGMKVGETKTVRLAPSEAYGEITESMMTEMSLLEAQEVFGDGILVGNVLPVTITTSSGTQRAYAKVMEINEEEGTMRVALMANALVGEYLTFEITLDSIA